MKTVPNEKICFQDATNTPTVSTKRQLLQTNNWRILFFNFHQEELIHHKIPVNPFLNLFLCCFKSQVSSIVYLCYTNWKEKRKTSKERAFRECRAPLVKTLIITVYLQLSLQLWELWSETEWERSRKIEMWFRGLFSFRLRTE